MRHLFLSFSNISSRSGVNRTLKDIPTKSDSLERIILHDIPKEHAAYILDRLFEALLSTSLLESFRMIKISSRHVQFGAKEARKLLNVLQHLYAKSSLCKFTMFECYETQFTIEAVQILASALQQQQQQAHDDNDGNNNDNNNSNNNTTTTNNTNTNNNKSQCVLPVTMKFERCNLIDDLSLSSPDDDYFTKFTINIGGPYATRLMGGRLETGRQRSRVHLQNAKQLIQSSLNLALIFDIDIRQIQIIYGTLSFEAFDYLHSVCQQPNDRINNLQSTFPIITSRAMEIFRHAKLSFGECEVFTEQYETNPIIGLTNGRFTLSKYSCKFSGFQIIGFVEALLLSHLLRRSLQARDQEKIGNHKSNISELCFIGCTIMIESIQTLLSPMIDVNRYMDKVLITYTYYTNCIFHLGGTTTTTTTTTTIIYPPIPSICRNEDENILEIKAPVASTNDDNNATVQNALMAIGKIIQHTPLYNNRNVFTIRLSEENISDNAILGILNSIQAIKTTMQYYNLQIGGGIGVEDQGAKYLSNALKEPDCNIKSILIRDGTSITNFGLKYIEQVLQHDNTSLKEIMIQNQVKYNKKILKRIHFFVALNWIHRDKLLQLVDESLSASLLSLVLQKGNRHASVLYWMLRQFPGVLFPFRNQQQGCNSNHRKRKHCEYSSS